MSLEVIYPQTTNVIPYNRNLLSFHGTLEYDENAKGDNGFHVDTTNARVVQYKNDKADFCVNLDHLTGMPMENFGLRGNCVRFPARQA